MFRPGREIIRIAWKAVLEVPDDGCVFVKEYRAVTRCKAGVDFLLRGNERLRGDDCLQGLFYDFPECPVVLVQQEHEPCRLRVESRRNVFYGKTHDLLDLSVVDRGFGRQFIIAAAVLQRVFQIFLHSHWHVIVCPLAKITQLWEKRADYNVK